MAMTISDFSKEEITKRIKSANAFCSLNYYDIQRYEFGIIRISYGVSFNKLGHAIFGALTLGVASISAKRSQIHTRFFDSETHQMVGTDWEEVKRHYQSIGDNYFINSDFDAANRAYYKILGIAEYNSTDDYKLYEVTNNMNKVIELITQRGEFSSALEIVNSQIQQFYSDLDGDKQAILRDWNQLVNGLMKTQHNFINGNYNLNLVLENILNIPACTFWKRQFQRIIQAINHSQYYEWEQAYSIFDELYKETCWNEELRDLIKNNLNFFKILMSVKLHISSSIYDEAWIQLNEATIYQENFCYIKTDLEKLKIVLDILLNIVKYTKNIDESICLMKSPEMKFVIDDETINLIFSKERILLEAFFQAYHALRNEITDSHAICHFDCIVGNMQESILTKELKRCLFTINEKNRENSKS